jgi:hypothetical protein
LGVDSRNHPQPDLLLCFLRGEVSLMERQAIVRHLLTGCRRCAAVTRPIWLLADLPVQRMDPLEG